MIGLLPNSSGCCVSYRLSLRVRACHPAAIMVGMGKAVNAGIWFKDAASMEEAAHVDTVVLDKTGTLILMETSKSPLFGKPQSAVYSEDDLYRIAASVEQNANHPFS